MVSFYIGRATKADIEKVALGLRVPQADVYRTLLEDGLQRIKDGKLKL